MAWKQRSGDLAGGASRRLDRATARLAAAFAQRSEETAAVYRDELALALRHHPSTAVVWFERYDALLSDSEYRSAFSVTDRKRLVRATETDDTAVLTMIFEMATRLGYRELQEQAIRRLVRRLATERDPNVLVSRLRRWRDLDLLDRDTVALALAPRIQWGLIGQEAPLWSAFLGDLPEALQPDLFDVHWVLGRITHAARLADTADRRLRALRLGPKASHLSEVDVLLALPHLGDHAAAVRCVHGRAGKLNLERGNHRAALAHFEAAERPGEVSECHEHLGDLGQALRTCPADRPGRLAGLVSRAQPGVDDLLRNGAYLEALTQAQGLLRELGRADPDDPGIVAGRADVIRQLVRIKGAANESYSAKDAQGTEHERLSLQLEWSQFCEQTGDPAETARHAAAGSDHERAHRFHLLAGQFAAAAADLSRWRGDRAIEEQVYIECLRRAGDLEQLVRACCQAAERETPPVAVATELRRLQVDPDLPVQLLAAVERALSQTRRHTRSRFERSAPGWVAEARREVDSRYCRTWGLDLGSSTCAVAVYDSRTGTAVVCAGSNGTTFPATLGLDAQGVEHVDPSGSGARIVARITGADRTIGSQKKHRALGELYRPEEIVARLIQHGRGLVEDFLAGQVRERLGEVAAARLDDVDEEWLAWADRHLDLRLSRPQVVIGLSATPSFAVRTAIRQAGAVAGVEVTHVMRSSVAASLVAARERRLDGSLLVVDLGARTLDIALVEVEEGICQVLEVLGDHDHGGASLGAEVARSLAARFEQNGTPIVGAAAQRRLGTVAEELLVALSSQSSAERILVLDDRELTVELDRWALGHILAGRLDDLEQACRAYHAQLDTWRSPELRSHLILLGGAALSPLVRERIESVFGSRRARLPERDTAVARGAAFQAAQVELRLKDLILLTPDQLEVVMQVNDGVGSAPPTVLIHGSRIVPARGRDVLVSRPGGSTVVRIGFRTPSEPEHWVVEFVLEQMFPTIHGESRIELRCELGRDGQLTVTAQDLATVDVRTIGTALSDVLSPADVQEMASRLQRAVVVHDRWVESQRS